MNMPSSSFLRILNILLFAACAAIFSPAALAQSSLTDDAHTSTAPRSADSNFGNNPNLSLSSSGNVYIKFNLVSTLPAGTPGSQVDKATLKLFIGNIASPGKVDVYEVLSPWQESTITANTAPILGSLVATTQQITTDQRGKFLVIDITATVRQWLGSDGQGAGGIPNHGIALLAHPVDANTPELINITFDSKENSQTSHEARLHIHLKDDAAGGLESVAHDATLTGDGTAGSPLGVAGGAISGTQLANGAVTETKLGSGAVTGAKLADGAVTSSKIASPLSLASADPAGTLSVANTGGGAAITAAGSVNVAGSMTANGSVSFLGLRTETTATTPNVIGGFSGNFVATGVIAATIGGGGGGPSPFPNRITADYGTIGGGRDNQAGDNVGSTLDSRFATVGGGDRNTASGNSSAVGGGLNNSARGVSSTVGGGTNNLADGNFATVPGGFANRARGNSSFAAGFGAKANHNGAFVWADSTNANFDSTANDQFLIRAAGGVGINTNAPLSILTISGTGSFSDSGAARFDLFNTTAGVSYFQHVFDNGRWQLGTGSSTRILVEANGNVGIGTGAVDKFQVAGDIRVGTGTTGCVKDADGTVIAGTCSSDLRYKKQITPFSNLIDKLARLQPVHFYWRADEYPEKHFGLRQSFGLIAQEVEQVLPELVAEDEQGYKSVNYSKLPLMLLQAVKELKAENDLLKQRLDEMSRQKEELKQQQAQIDRLKKIVCLSHPDEEGCR
ncbi:MAG TPA: DNRLRE domain-containing protein [Blastocatellia bacterium]|nr:DNRLRE domain-containing protein [Blastocatellia bacterium]